jgi:putative intracellular protease/amidase
MAALYRIETAAMASVLIPVPRCDFDPTEVAVSWQVLTRLGHEVVFATPAGEAAAADELMVSGEGLDPWGWVPGLRRLAVVGRALRANSDARSAYALMQGSEEFRNPLAWESVALQDLDGLLLPGGHRARGMRSYLESERLKQLVVCAFDRDIPVGAICHGVLLAARSIDPESGRSVLYGRRTTALTWELERTASRVARVSRFWDPGYYRTYRELEGQPPGYMSVQAEVTRALARPDDFLEVDPSEANARRRRGGRSRDSLEDPRPAFVVQDGRYTSARWPGDTYTFARRFAESLDTVTQNAPTLPTGGQTSTASARTFPPHRAGVKAARRAQ